MLAPRALHLALAAALALAFAAPAAAILDPAKFDAEVLQTGPRRSGLERHVHDEAGARALREAAERGEPRAMAELGWVLYAGGGERGGLRRDMAAGLAWLERAAAKGQAEAGYRAAWHHLAMGDMDRDGQRVAALLEGAARGGYVVAFGALGEMHEGGTGVKADPAAALAWFRRGAEAGDAWSQYRLGQRLAAGRGVARDPAKAAGWFRRAAEQVLGRAQVALAEAYDLGAGVPKDRAKALKWWTLAADQDEPAALRALAKAHARGDGVRHDPGRAAELLARSARAGDLLATLELARRQLTGDGVKKDEKAARDTLRWSLRPARPEDARLAGEALAGFPGDEFPGEGYFLLLVAAERGAPSGAIAALEKRLPRARVADARFRLAEAYQQGGPHGLRRDEAARMTWLRKAAESGHVKAMVALAVLHEQRSWKVKAELADAARWWRRAAELGDPRAMLETGQEAFWRGNDPAEGQRWFEKAAAADAYVQYQVGGYYLHHISPVPKGLPKQVERGLTHLRRSAERGNRTGMEAYGTALLTGRFGPRVPEEGRRWLEKAAAAGAERAGYELGQAYAKGDGLPKDDAAALRWFLHDAEKQHHAGAAHEAAELLVEGRGGPRDVPRALRLLLAAVDRGSTRSMERLGRWFEGGGPVAKDEDLAYLFYALYARRASPPPAGYAALKARMTPERIKAAQGRFEALFKEHGGYAPRPLPS